MATNTNDRYHKRKSKGSSDNPLRSGGKSRAKSFGGQNARDQSDIKRIQMYRGGKPIRNKKGVVVGGDYMMRNRAGNRAITAETGRVQPDRRWFGNTRVIAQKELDSFREKMTTKAHDPYQVLLRSKKLPMGLLQDATEAKRMRLLDTETFEETFSSKRRRKRPKLGASDMAELASAAAEAGGTGMGQMYNMWGSR